MLSKGIARHNHTVARPLNARGIYELLLEVPDSEVAPCQSMQFLQEQLERARQLPHDFPAKPRDLEHWIEHKALEVGERYAAYIERRKQGERRQYFLNKSHALSFLQQVAPTKLVDGAWLYGTLRHWQDTRLYGLARTYLEELGNGEPDQNHVRLYQRLLAENDCEPLPVLNDEHYVRGAIQLAFGHNAEQFLPELVGYNLGYEQPPLHLLITAFELAELGIDPYYFTLHITVDNASTGHARKAALAAKACIPVSGNTQEFWRRVINGYQLNDVGLGATTIISEFDLEHELIGMLERKRPFGQNVHSDFCTLDGQTVNEWLSKPDQLHRFLEILKDKQWIIHNEDPQKSRFWRLIDGPKAPMAGVFSGYEKQLLHDWISGDQISSKPPRKRRTFRRYPQSHPHPAVAQNDARQRFSGSDDMSADDMGADVRHLQRDLCSLTGERRMLRLIEFMSPSKHATAVGLFATREFVAAMNARGN